MCDLLSMDHMNVTNLREGVKVMLGSVLRDRLQIDYYDFVSIGLIIRKYLVVIVE